MARRNIIATARADQDREPEIIRQSSRTEPTTAAASQMLLPVAAASSVAAYALSSEGGTVCKTASLASRHIRCVSSEAISSSPILKWARGSGCLRNAATIRHIRGHCWRCGNNTRGISRSGNEKPGTFAGTGSVQDRPDAGVERFPSGIRSVFGRSQQLGRLFGHFLGRHDTGFDQSAKAAQAGFCSHRYFLTVCSVVWCVEDPNIAPESGATEEMLTKAREIFGSFRGSLPGIVSRPRRLAIWGARP